MFVVPSRKETESPNSNGHPIVVLFLLKNLLKYSTSEKIDTYFPPRKFQVVVVLTTKKAVTFFLVS